MKLKLIQVGLGAHGTNVGKHFVLSSQDFEYVGLVDIDEKRLEECAKLFDVPKECCYSHYQEAFQNLQADAILITAISPAHYDICKAALLHGLHVLLEKPFVLNMNDAIKLVELGISRKKHIMINQNYRFFHTVQLVKKALQQKIFGNPLFVNAQFYFNHQGKPYQMVMHDYMLLEMAVHHIDMIRFLFDSNIENVRGKTWNLTESGYKGDPNVSAIYELDTGLPVFYFGSLLAKGLATPWEGTWRIQCEEGSIHLDDLGQGYGVYLVDANQQKVKWTEQITNPDGIHGTLIEFALSIREDRQPMSSGQDNLHTLAALFATSTSSKDGKVMYPIDLITSNL
ncbi:Gfo/Idh/MocA family protein [Bacillaceae bacterium C204]|uniref:Gfo/Idh/MocA family protein n=1 Tax=Neobacillus sp. 204 TaxID=3383351 RepID=UPI003979E0ED